MYTYMTKVISISDEAYEILRRLKMSKSFSETIIEIAKEKNDGNLMKFAGVISKEEGEKIKKEIYQHRKMPSRRFK